MIRLIAILFLLLVSCGTATYTTITPTNPPSAFYYFPPPGAYISPNRWNFYSWRYVPSPPIVVTPPRYYYQSPPRRVYPRVYAAPRSRNR